MRFSVPAPSAGVLSPPRTSSKVGGGMKHLVGDTSEPPAVDPERPCVVMAITVRPFPAALSTITSAGLPCSTRQSTWVEAANDVAIFLR
jgi:hypothetical protein